MNLLSFKQVHFYYDTQSRDLFSDINLALTNGWSGIIGGNGTGKSTLLKLAAGFLLPVKGRIEGNEDVYYCAQTTDIIPEGFEDLLLSYTAGAGRLIAHLGIGYDWIDRWDTLSFGERKKAQVASALFLNPPVLAIDEPSNHLDIDSAHRVGDALKRFTGIGLIVSHNRRLLNALCCRCLFIESGRIVLRRGGYDEMAEVRVQEKAALKKRRDTAQQQVKRLTREIQRRKVKADAADGKRSKQGISSKDHDAKAKINLARLSGKDAVAGKLYDQLAGRLNQATGRVRELRVEKEYETGVWLDGSRSGRDVLVRLPPGQLPICRDREIEHDRILVRPQDKIGITGRNGTGKSYFLSYLAQKIGKVSDKLLHIPQELTEEGMQATLDEVRKQPSEILGRIMTVVRRLGSDPKRLFDQGAGSPGEIKKLMIARAVIQRTQVLLLDEPTNHLDLLSVEALETALTDYPGCLICVSHDADLIARVTRARWTFERKDRQGGRISRITQT